MAEPSDVELLRGAVERGDRDSFGELYRRHETAAYNLAMHVTGNRALAEDAVQSAMIRVWKYARTYDEAKGSVRSWLLRIVARQSMERLMAERKRSRKMADDSETLERRADTDARGPSERAEHGEALAALQAILRRLPEPERHLVALYYGGGFSQEEIADTLALPRRTVSFRIQKVLDRMREELKLAGFATAAPLLAGERLAEALCTGTHVPASLGQRVLEGVAQANLLRASASLSRRAAAPGWSSTLSWLGGAVILLAGGAGLWFAAPSSTPPRTAAAPAQAAEQAPEAPANRVWTFENGPAPDLTPNEGAWAWKKEDKPWGGVMQLLDQEAVSMPLPVKIPRQPFLIRTEHTAVTTPKGDWKIFFCGFYGKMQKDLNEDFYEGRLIHHTPIMDPRIWHEIHTYFFDRYVFVYTDRVLACLYTLSKPYPREDVFISFGGFMNVRKIEFQVLKEHQLPADLRNPEALIQRMMATTDAKNRPKLLLDKSQP